MCSSTPGASTGSKTQARPSARSACEQRWSRSSWTQPKPHSVSSHKCTSALADAGRRQHLAAREDDAVLAACLDEAALELLRVEVGIEATAAEQVLVRPLLDEATAVEDEDHVRGEDRREAVRDRDRRALLDQRLERRLDEPLARRVQSRRRLVEDQHPR